MQDLFLQGKAGSLNQSDRKTAEKTLRSKHPVWRDTDKQQKILPLVLGYSFNFCTDGHLIFFSQSVLAAVLPFSVLMKDNISHALE